MKNRKERPDVIYGNTRLMKTGCGNLYVTINEYEDKPFEVFATLGKAGGCGSAQCESIGRSISVGLQGEIAIEEYINSLRGIKCSETPKGIPKYSCADAMSKAMEIYLTAKNGERKEETDAKKD